MSQNELTLYSSLFDDLTPSSLIQHIIDGIHRFIDHPTFKYDMITFGANASDHYGRGYQLSDGPVCVGCLATSTIFTIMNEEPTPENIHMETHPKNGYTAESVREVEYAVNTLRCYNVEDFLVYFRREKQKLQIDLGFIKQIKQEFSEVTGTKKPYPIIGGHPTHDQLFKYIDHMKDLQIILKNHNL